MSTAYEAVAPTRPRIRHDVLYTRTEDGVLFHNSHTGFRLTSPTAYRLASLLVPYLNGRHQVAAICAPLPEAQRTMIGELVRALYDREFARDIPEPDGDPSALLGSAVAERFAAQIAYIDHYVGGAPQRFAEFRATPVTVLGTGSVALACATSLVRNGAASVTVSAGVAAGLADELAELTAAGCAASVERLPEQAEPGWTDLHTAGIVIVASGDDAPRDCLRLLADGVPAGRRLLPTWVAGPRVLVGPLHETGRSGCWCCAMLWLADNDDSGAAARAWQAAALPPQARIAGERLSDPLAAMVGNLLAYEVFRLTTGALPAETDGSVIVQHIASLDVLVEPLLTHPACGFCAPRAELPDLEHLVLDPASVLEEPDSTVAADEAVAQLAAHQPLLNPHLGVLRRYDDEHWEQTPIKAGSVEFTAGGRRRTVSAFDVHHVAAARLRALRTAMVVASGHAAVVAPPDADSPRFGAQELGLASGWSDAPSAGQGIGSSGGDGIASSAGWAAARSLRTGRSVAVPLAVLEPFGPANHDRAAEPTSAGGGAGGDIAEAVQAGLASALGYTALRDAIAGTAPVRRVRPDTLGTAPELVFLAKSAANLGITWDLLEFACHRAPAASVLMARYWDAERRRWWHALHADPVWGAAATAALRDLLGQAQLRRQAPAVAVDSGDPALVDFDAGSLVAESDMDGRPQAAARWSDVLAELADHGTDVLVAPVSGPGSARGGLVAVRVLLAPEAGR